MYDVALYSMYTNRISLEDITVKSERALYPG